MSAVVADAVKLSFIKTEVDFVFRTMKMFNFSIEITY